MLAGTVLRMWRPRPGQPDTAVDVGAKPGTAVFSPVTGTVVKVKRYKLYGKCDDYEIHIQPDGYPNLDLVMIHIDDVVVLRRATAWSGGRDAHRARCASSPTSSTTQLASYTKDGGNHMHLQLNDATDPTYKGLEGAINPDGRSPARRSTASYSAPCRSTNPRKRRSNS